MGNDTPIHNVRQQFPHFYHEPESKLVVRLKNAHFWKKSVENFGFRVLIWKVFNTN